MRTTILLMLLLLSSCTQQVLQPVSGYRPAQPLTDGWTFLNMSYGDVGITFINNQVVCFNNAYNDTTDRSFLIYSDNGTYQLTIKIKGDSLLPGTYNIDGRNGSVEIYQYGRMQIGMMQPSSFFSLSINAKDRKEVDGLYSGLLTNPLNGQQVQITGSIENLYIPL